MRGRTNISTGTDMTVNGDVISAIAAENIQAREFVSYEIKAQVKELLNVNFLPYDSNTDVKVDGNLIYALSSNSMYVFENQNGELNLKSVYSDYIINGFEIIDQSYIVIYTKDKLITLLKNDGILLYASEFENPLDGTECIFYRDGVLYAFSKRRGSVSGTTKKYKYLLTICAIDCSNPVNLFLISQKEDIEAIPSTTNGYGNVHTVNWCGGHFCVFFKTGESPTLRYYYASIMDISVGGETISTDFKRAVSLGEDLSASFVFSKWVVYGKRENDYNLSASAPDLSMLNVDTGGITKVNLKTLGFDKEINGISSATNGYHSRLSLSKVGEKKLFVAVALYSTYVVVNPAFDCGVLEFNESTGTFALSGNILDLTEAFKDKKYSELTTSAFFAENYFVLGKVRTEYKFYYVEILESDNILSLHVNENRVTKYDGGIAIGFSKTAAKANEEIQVYIPKIEGD